MDDDDKSNFRGLRVRQYWSLVVSIVITSWCLSLSLKGYKFDMSIPFLNIPIDSEYVPAVLLRMNFIVGIMFWIYSLRFYQLENKFGDEAKKFIVEKLNKSPNLYSGSFVFRLVVFLFPMVILFCAFKIGSNQSIWVVAQAVFVYGFPYWVTFLLFEVFLKVERFRKNMRRGF